MRPTVMRSRIPRTDWDVRSPKRGTSRWRALLAIATAVITCLAVLAACGGSSKHSNNANVAHDADDYPQVTSPKEFGSVDVGGGVHESITNTLACGSYATAGPSKPAPGRVPYCFEGPSTRFGFGPASGVGRQSYSMYELAGYGSNRPDFGPYKQTPSWHCDNGDHAGGISTSSDTRDWPRYPQAYVDAKAALTACIDQFDYRMELAVWLARYGGPDGQGLLTNGGVAPGKKFSSGCYRSPWKDGQGPYYWKDPQGAKCEVLNQIGRALHTAQDFLTHSNWADFACVKGATNCPQDRGKSVNNNWGGVAEPVKPTVVPGEFTVANPIGLGYSAFPPSKPQPKSDRPTGQLPDFFQFQCNRVKEPVTPNAQRLHLGAVVRCRPNPQKDDNNTHLVTSCNYVVRYCGDGVDSYVADVLFKGNNPPPTITHYHLNKDVGSVQPVQRAKRATMQGQPRLSTQTSELPVRDNDRRYR